MNFKSPPLPPGDSANELSLGNTGEWEGHMSRGGITEGAYSSFHEAGTQAQEVAPSFTKVAVLLDCGSKSEDTDFLSLGAP